MAWAFYFSALVALLATLGVITNRNPMHALLYLIVSLLSVAMVFFSLGAEFAGAIQIIVYAGAILVLFVFVVMMLNLGSAPAQEQRWLTPRVWMGPAVLSALLFAVLVFALSGMSEGSIGLHALPSKAVGIALFGPYILAVELASLLLLAGMVSAYHLGRENKPEHKKGLGDKR